MAIFLLYFMCGLQAQISITEKGRIEYGDRKKLVKFAVEAHFDQLPSDVTGIVKDIVVDVVGTTIAGATAEGCQTLVNQVRKWGGKRESTIPIHGSKVPAHNAAFVNSVMARAHDYENAMFPGIHISASTVPKALAAAELFSPPLLTALILLVYVRHLRQPPWQER